MIFFQFGHTPLYGAALMGHVAVVELLLQNKADTGISYKVCVVSVITPYFASVTCKSV